MTEKYLCLLVGQMTCICNMNVRRQALDLFRGPWHIFEFFTAHY